MSSAPEHGASPEEAGAPEAAAGGDAPTAESPGAEATLSEDALALIRTHRGKKPVKWMAKEIGAPVSLVRAALHRIEGETAAARGKPTAAARDAAPAAVAGASVDDPWAGPRALVGAVVVLVLVVLIGYGGTLGHDFHFDDNQAIVDNKNVKDPAIVWHQFPSTRFLNTLSFVANGVVNRRLFGPENALAVGSFHVVNMGIHLLAALMLYLLGVEVIGAARARGRLSPRGVRIVALIAAAIFAAHPLQTQAVTYLAQRTEALCALFALAAFWAYARGRRAQEEVVGEGAGGETGSSPAFGDYVRAALDRRVARWYLVALLATGGGLLSKEVGGTIPAVILALELCLYGRTAWLRVLPILAGLAVATTLAVLVSRGAGLARILTPSDVSGVDHGHVQYALTQLRVFLSYLRLMVLPIGQCVDHDVTPHRAFFAEMSGGALLSDLALTLLALAANLGLVGFAAWAFRRGDRLVAFGLASFYLVLAPSSSIVLLPDLMFEHRVYLPLGLIALAVCATLARRFAERPGRGRLVLIWAAVGAIGLLVITTRVRNAVWESNLTLWTDAVEKAPDKARPHSNLGLAWQQLPLTAESDRDRLKERMSNLARAEEHYRRAIEIDEDFTKARNNLGMIEIERGRVRLSYSEQASAEAKKLRRSDPTQAKKLASIAEQQRQIAFDHFVAAEAVFRETMEIDPDDFVGRNNLANMYQQFLSKWDPSYVEEAVPILEEVVVLSKDRQPTVRVVLGDLYRILGDRRRGRGPSARQDRAELYRRGQEHYRIFLRRTERLGHEKREHAETRLEALERQLEQLGERRRP